MCVLAPNYDQNNQSSHYSQFEVKKYHFHRGMAQGKISTTILPTIKCLKSINQNMQSQSKKVFLRVYLSFEIDPWDLSL